MDVVNEERAPASWNFDVAPDILPPAKQQLVLLNRDEVINARATARKLSIDAIERASR